MKRLQTWLAPAFLGSALLAASLPSDAVSFRPEKGLSLSRSFASKQEVTLDDLNMTMNGNPMPMQMSMTMSMNQTVDVTDEFMEVADGQVQQLRRTFDKIASDGSFTMESPMMPEPTEKTVTAKSELESKTVIFKRDPETKKFKASFRDDEGDAKLLEKLVEDMDLTALLPEGDKKDGDTWPVELERLKTILMPGGDLSLKPQKDEAEMGFGEGMDSAGDLSKLLDELEGEATGTYLGKRDVDGTSCAVIRLKFKIKSAKDLTEDVKGEMAGKAPEGIEMEVDHVDVDLEMEGEGELLWNAGAGYAHSFSMSSTVKTNMDMGFLVNANGNDMKINQTFTMSGNHDLKVAVTKN
jgi:hypothetical protein